MNKRINAFTRENVIARLSKEKASQFLMNKMPAEELIEETLAEFRLTGDTVYRDIQKMLMSGKTAETVPFTTNTKNGEKENQDSSASISRGSRVTTSKAASDSGRGRGAGRGSSRSTANSSTKTQLNASVSDL